MASKWTDLPYRLTTICIGVPILWNLWLYPFWLRLFWVGTHLVVAIEWAIVSRQQPRWFFPFLSIFLVQYFDTTRLLGAMVFGNCLSQLFLGVESNLAITRGLLLVCIPFHFWLRIASNSSHGFHQTVTLLFTVWNCDTGALVAGRLFGGKYIRNQTGLRSISPKKSMEGLLGGFMFGLISYAIMPCVWKWLERFHVPTKSASAFSDMRSVEEWMADGLIGVILSGGAIIGDLWESSLKRQYNVKDTSKLLPGHGGVLDRFDSSLISVVLYVIYLESSASPPKGY